MPALFSNGRYRAWVYEWDLDALGEARVVRCQRTEETLVLFADSESNHGWPFTACLVSLKAENREAEHMVREAWTAEALLGVVGENRFENMRTMDQVLLAAHKLKMPRTTYASSHGNKTVVMRDAIRAFIVDQLRQKWVTK